MNIQTVMYGPMIYGMISKMYEVSQEEFEDFQTEMAAVQ